MAKKTTFVVSQDKKGEYRWKLLASNGESVAVGGEGFTAKRTAMAAVKKLRIWSATDVVIDETVSSKTAPAKAVAKKAPVVKK